MYYNVLQYLEKTAELWENKISYSDETNQICFSELMEVSRRIGSYISSIVQPRNPVVVFMKKHVYNLTAFFGVVYAGCFYTPIDKDMPVERVKSILNTLSPSLIIYDDSTSEIIDELQKQYRCIHLNVAKGCCIDEKRLNCIRNDSTNTDLLYVLFTSGTTGIPKGVTISHAAVIDFVEWIVNKYNLNCDTVLCNQAPFYFDASVPDIFIPLVTGATVYIPPKSFYTFPKKILEYIIDKGVNTIIWVPSALCNVVNCKAFDVCVPTGLELIIFCGEVMPCKFLNVWRKNIPDALYVNMYGPTEATYACMYYDIDREYGDDEQLPLGRSCENCKILLVYNDEEVVKENEIGEICVLGQCLSYGYYNAPEKTSAAFVQNPTNQKWTEYMYRTGDLGYWKGDRLFFSGRKDYQIKRLGHRIELGEIESSLLLFDRIENVCCVFNEETEDIIAVYKGEIDEKELFTFLKKRLPYYMIPTSFIRVRKMPLNLNGKIDRKMIQNEYAGGK